jgi:multidrug resistance protein MdtO
MTISNRGERAPAAADPTLAFIKRELAPSPDRWTGSLVFAGLAMLGVLATVTFRIPFPVLVFVGILLLSTPHPEQPIRQAIGVSAAAIVGGGIAILIAVTTYDQPWLYLPLQCAALTASRARSSAATTL